MNAILHPLFVILAALSAALGTPQNTSNLHPRVPGTVPASMQSFHDIAPTDSVEISGTVQSVTSNLDGTTTIVLNDGTMVIVDTTTETNGNLQPGMLVNIEGTPQPDGSILANEIKPGLGKGDDKGNGVDKGKGDDSRDVITATLTITNDDHIDDDKMITVTGTITGDEEMGDRQVITGTMGAENKHNSQNGEDQNGTLGNGVKFNSPKGIQFNGGNANSNASNGSDKNHQNVVGNNGGTSQNHSDGNQNSQGSQGKSDQGGGKVGGKDGGSHH
jgi:hypothetical protein